MKSISLHLIGTVVVVVLLFWLLPSGSLLAQDAFPPQTDTYLNDFAGLLSTEDETTLRRKLSEFAGESGVEMTVLTIASIADYDPDASLESFATALFNAWGIDDQTTNDGVLLLVVANDRQVRVELGRRYGRDYDRAVQAVIDEEILPAFRTGDYATGIFSGVDGLQTAVIDPPPATGFLQNLLRRLAQNRLVQIVGGSLLVFFLYRQRHVRGGWLMKPLSLAIYAMIGAGLGALGGSTWRLLGGEVAAAQSAIDQLPQLFTSGAIFRETAQWGQTTTQGLGIGALVGVVFWFLPALSGDGDSDTYDGGGGGDGSSGGGGGSGSW